MTPSARTRREQQVNGRRRLSRQELAPEAREAIFNATIAVIKDFGYAGATIARITETAGIAQGTFYLYFQSRDELLDQLLPHAGLEMIRFIGSRVTGAKDVWDAEERGFRAFFEYAQSKPGIYRVVNEAEVAAPKAFKKHFHVLIKHYVDSLARGVATGEISRFDRSELETIAYVLMSARGYLYLRYLKDSRKPKAMPENIVQSYMKLVRGGLT